MGLLTYQTQAPHLPVALMGAGWDQHLGERRPDG